MFDTPITKEQKDYAWKFVSRCNVAKRGKFDGSKERQFLGLVGQTVMADCLDSPRPVASKGSDGGVDFVIDGVNVDIKTVGRNVPVQPHFANNLVAMQTKLDTDIYVFASINKKNSIMTVCGVMEKGAVKPYLKKEGTISWRNDGTQLRMETDNYEIPTHDLHQVNNWRDVLSTIIILGEQIRQIEKQGGQANAAVKRPTNTM